jgi:hypothetical protein
MVRGVAQPYLGARAAAPGDVMADGGEPVDGDAAARSFREARSAERRQEGGRSQPRTSAESGGSAHRGSCSSRLLLQLRRWQPGLVAELAQRVVAAAHQLARHRQRRSFATQSIADGVVVGVVR